MKAVQTFNTTFLLVHFDQATMRVLDGERRLEVSFERQSDGRVGTSAKGEIIRKLQDFLGTQWGPRRKAVCAIGARGVSVRRLSLPACPEKNFREMLALQVEREVPLPPAELAWGYVRVPAVTPAMAAGEQQLILAAVRHDLVEEYSEILGACRLTPVFTPGIFSLLTLCSNPPRSHALLDIGRLHCELICCVDGLVESLRILQFGGETITAAIAHALTVSEHEAERLKLQWSEGLLKDAAQVSAIDDAARKAIWELGLLVSANWKGDRLDLVGRTAMSRNASGWLQEAIGTTAKVEVIQKMDTASATLEALRVQTGAGRREPVLLLRSRESERTSTAIGTAGMWKWAAVTAVLVVASLSFRYAEPLLKKPGLERRLAAAAVEHTSGPEINYELTFLQHIEEQQSPYLIVMNVLGEATPQGARFDSLSMTRRGDVTFQTTLRGADQAIALRAKLIASGVFSSVVVEDQRPSPQDRERLIVRINARCKPAAEIRATVSGAGESFSTAASQPITRR